MLGRGVGDVGAGSHSVSLARRDYKFIGRGGYAPRVGLATAVPFPAPAPVPFRAPLPASVSAPTTTRFCCASVFCVYRELNLTTALIALKVLTFNGRGILVTRKVNPSAHGGVVSEPEYWKRGVVWMCLMTWLKSSGPVSVDAPGVVIEERF